MGIQETNNHLSVVDSAETGEEGINIREIIHILWIRRWVILGVASGLSAFAAINIQQLVPLYTASAMLKLGGSKTQVVDIDAVLGGDMSSPWAIMSEVEVLKSRELARKVIEKLELDKTPEFNPKPGKPGILAGLNPINRIPEDWLVSLGIKKPAAAPLSEKERKERLTARLISSFLARLSIEPVRMSHVVKIGYETENPKLAAQIANAVADQYIFNQLEAKFEATRKASQWLNEQLSDLREKVEQSEKAVEIYRQEAGLTKSKDTVLSAQQLSEINSQLIIARTKRAEIEARLRQVERLLKTGDSLETSTEVLSSGLIQSLREEEIGLLRRKSEMATVYGAKHPKMIQIQAEIADLRDKIKMEIKKIAANLRNEAEVARTREGTLAASLKKLENTTGTQKRAEVQLRTLEREAAANRALYETFLNRFKETSSTEGMQEPDARIISKAEVPTAPSYPNKKRMMILSVFGSLMAALGIVFLLEKLNPGLRSPEQIEDVLGRSVLGVIPSLKDGNPLDFILKNPHSSLTEAINSLRVSLMLLNPDQVVKTVLVTSSVPEEGKSTLSLLLARVVAHAGQRVVLVDADLRRPAVETMLGLGSAKGLTDYLMAPDAEVEPFLVKDEASGLHVLSKGQAGYVNSTALFASHRMEALMTRLREEFDMVILDSPPVMSVTDSRVLAKLVDKTVFVVRWDHTPRKVIKTAIQQLPDAGDNLAGIVLQRVNLKQYGRYSYGDSGYYYHYGRYRNYYSES